MEGDKTPGGEEPSNNGKGEKIQARWGGWKMTKEQIKLAVREGKSPNQLMLHVGGKQKTNIRPPTRKRKDFRGKNQDTKNSRLFFDGWGWPHWKEKKEFETIGDLSAGLQT